MATWWAAHWRDVVSVAGLGVTVAGFWVAITQIRKAVWVATATQEAVRTATARLAVNYALILGTQLQEVANGLELARMSGDENGAHLALLRWRQTASMLRGRLEHASTASELVTALRNSVALVASAQTALKRQPSVEAATRKVSAEIGKASDLVGVLLAQLLVEVASEGTNDGQRH